MNNIEKIAIDELRGKLYEALDRVSEKNKDRIEHERIFIQRDIKDSIKIVDAIIENNPQLYPK